MVHDLLAEQTAERVSELVGKQVAKQVAKRAEKVVAKAGQHADQLDRLADHLETIEVWTRRGNKGRQPRLSCDDIAAAAMRIADAEGFAALSMRRLGAELDVGTMSLYHYVRTKEELLTLVFDAMMAEVLVPQRELDAPWRDALTAIARRSRDALLRHPWVLDITDDPPIGPNAMRHFDQSLQATKGLDVPLDVKLDLILAIDEYVFGYCIHARNNLQADQLEDDIVRSYMAGMLEGGDYPAIAELVDRDGFDSTWDRITDRMRNTQRFDRNIARIIDGFSASK
jgi:AcrR family transcriptional regulator